MRTSLEIINQIEKGLLLKDFRDIKKNDDIDGFNVFTLTSDLYYRENYHSDILSAFLRYKDKETGKYTLLEAFFEMLNAARRKDTNIDIKDYTEPDITRESHRIDILIKDKKTRRCIIIENKINDAPDMQRQLPRYYSDMENEGRDVDAIVYLTKGPNVFPDWLDWSEEEIPLVRDLLITIPMLNSYGCVSLISNWINPGIIRINDVDVLSSLRQYGRLLTKLSQNTQQINLMKELLSKLQNDVLSGLKVNDFLALRDIINKMHVAMADDLRTKFSSIFDQKDTKYSVTGWQPNSCVISLDKENAIFVYCVFREDKAYSLGVADFSQKDRSTSWFNPSQLGEDYMENHQLVINSDNNSDFKFQFGFYEKSNVVELVKKLVEQYSAYIKNNNQLKSK